MLKFDVSGPVNRIWNRVDVHTGQKQTWHQIYTSLCTVRAISDFILFEFSCFYHLYLPKSPLTKGHTMCCFLQSEEITDKGTSKAVKKWVSLIQFTSLLWSPKLLYADTSALLLEVSNRPRFFSSWWCQWHCSHCARLIWFSCCEGSFLASYHFSATQSCISIQHAHQCGVFVFPIADIWYRLPIYGNSNDIFAEKASGEAWRCVCVCVCYVCVRAHTCVLNNAAAIKRLSCNRPFFLCKQPSHLCSLLTVGPNVQ